MNHYKIISAECDLPGTYDFDPNGNSRIGHFKRLSIANKDLETDTLVSIPDHPSTLAKIVGPIGYIEWEGADIFEFSGKVSPKNKAIMQEALTSSIDEINIEAEWVIYDYDFHVRKYFQRMHTNNKLIKFEFVKNLNIYLSEDPDRDIKKPINFTFQFCLRALQKIKQEIFWACSSTGTQLSRQASSLVL